MFSSNDYQHIVERMEYIRQLYNKRITMAAVAAESGISKRQVSEVLNALGYKYGVDRSIEPLSGHPITVGQRLDAFGFLLLTR